MHSACASRVPSLPHRYPPLPLPNLLKKQTSRPAIRPYRPPTTHTLPFDLPHAMSPLTLMPYHQLPTLGRRRGPPAILAVWALRPRFSNNHLHVPPPSSRVARSTRKPRLAAAPRYRNTACDAEHRGCDKAEDTASFSNGRGIFDCRRVTPSRLTRSCSCFLCAHAECRRETWRADR
jgi:hypothetical protein